MTRTSRKSSLHYYFPLPVTSLTTQPPAKFLKRLSGELGKLGPFTIETGSPAHQKHHAQAVDFIVPPGTPVLAAAAGRVTKKIDRFSIPRPFRQVGYYCLTRFFRRFPNFITIEHKQGSVKEYTQYLHLERNSAKVKVGQLVKPGQIIGRTGWSGWLDRPHLHFAVFKEDSIHPYHFQALVPRWQNQS
jgi:murein DD-endopeptidase MepM/ murein hydrolase activator NlpD